MNNEPQSEETEYPSSFPSSEEMAADKWSHYKVVATAISFITLITMIYCQWIWIISIEFWNFLDLDLISWFKGVQI